MTNDQRNVDMRNNWICEYCGRENYNTQCFYCGAPKPMQILSEKELEFIRSVSRQISEAFLSILRN